MLPACDREHHANRQKQRGSKREREENEEEWREKGAREVEEEKEP